ncbi:hypothetical protein CSA56_13110 [candidate division KSB3 bacterium]|uniref:Uncharacterized protein n=1 Tax=candidate division KSB3 bacterium TaxID=2044937 RepID=A0A2G6KBR4_9BACT|nr:MAG: hypothetical protein CSA56_13110 [candidate division KSB3 bacterium]
MIVTLSPQYPASKSVERDFDAWYAQLADKEALHSVKVDVVNTPELSRHLADELQVRHESPQAIWLTKDLHIHWHASHRSMSNRAVNQQLDTVLERHRKLQSVRSS